MIVAITSAGGGVGKTSISVAIADEATARGLKSCIVDMDFSPGTFHAIYGLNRHKSIKEAAENPSKVMEYIQQPEEKCFYVLSGGLPVVADLLGKDKTEIILQELNKNFDLVIVDTSSQSTESSLTAIRLSDSTLFIVTPEDYIGIRGVILLDFIKNFNLSNINKFEAVINHRQPGKVKVKNITGLPVSLIIPYVKKHTPDNSKLKPFVKPLIDIWYPDTQPPKVGLIKKMFGGR